jgi:AbrB family looped-hinge helix DNA binding protein
MAGLRISRQCDMSFCSFRCVSEVSMTKTQPAIGTRVVKTLRGGQITLPAEFRRALDIEEGTVLTVSITEHGELRVRPVQMVSSRTGGSPWLKELYELFAPVRQEILEKGYTEEEVNQWIDEAVAEVRRERRLRSTHAADGDSSQADVRRAG